LIATEQAILATGLRKRYGTKAALDGFSLSVPKGTVCGLLGPNGAGKTTAVRILSTLLRLDEGQAWVAGFDVARQAAQVRYRIGLLAQASTVDEVISGRQNLELFGRLYHLGARDARIRAGQLLEQFGLADTAGLPVKHYSGGMRRRLDLAASLILAPAVLFLDEPTTGLDPRGRNEMWDAIRALVAHGTTVLLTTQYLEEADQLSDQISLIDHGRVVANDSPDRLKTMIGGDRINVLLGSSDDLASTAALIGRAAGAEVEVDEDARTVTVRVRDRVANLTDVVRALDDAGIAAQDVVLRRPTLDEVFLQLTGHAGEEAEANGADQAAVASKKEVAAP
jgi:ABC-2 type transport system ATP-binding protein